ncbi:MAG: FAD-binding oxidoreductase [Candidatus Parvarchaeota archaeon]
MKDSIISDTLVFTKTGMIVLVSRDQRDFFEKNVAMLQKIGINELLIDKIDFEKIYPYLSLDHNFYEKVAYEPESGYADPVAVANSFASKAIESNVSYINDTVIKIKSEDQRIVLKSGKEINYDKVILATNIWTNSILENSNADILPLKISPHPIIIFKRPEKYQGFKPIIFDLLQKVYFKPEGLTLLIGGSFNAEIDKVSIKLDEMDNYSTVSFDYVTDYSKMVVERIPLMKDGFFHSSYYGFYDNSPDGQPIIDSCEKLGLKNVYCIAGLSGHGFKLSPAFGFMVSEMVLYNNFSVFDWTKFNLDRFKYGKTEFESYDGLGTIG